MEHTFSPVFPTKLPSSKCVDWCSNSNFSIFYSILFRSAFLLYIFFSFGLSTNTIESRNFCYTISPSNACSEMKSYQKCKLVTNFLFKVQPYEILSFSPIGNCIVQNGWTFMADRIIFPPKNISISRVSYGKCI